MRVSREMVQADKQVEDDILSHMKYISEVVILATPVNPKDSDSSASADKATNATKCHNSVVDLKVKGIEDHWKL